MYIKNNYRNNPFYYLIQYYKLYDRIILIKFKFKIIVKLVKKK